MNTKEYLMLREEIMYQRKVQDAFIQFAYTVVATLWAAAIVGIGNEWIVFLSLIIIIPISLRVWHSRQSIAFLATYMSIFLEGIGEQDTQFNWETRHIMYYNRFDRTISEKIIYYFSRLDFSLLSIAGAILFWALRHWHFVIMGSKFYAVGLLSIQVLITILEIILCFKYTNVSHLKDKKVNNWKIFKEEIQSC